MRRMLGRRTAWIAAGFAVAAAAAGVAIGATVAGNGFVDTSGDYHGCVNTTNGNLRVVQPDSACREAETSIEWPGPGSAGGIARFQDLTGTPCMFRDKPGVTVVNTSAYSMAAECLRADTFEPNDTRATAADVSDWGMRFDATIFPAGDDDWYVVHDWYPSVLRIVPADGSIASFTAELYVDGNLVATAQADPWSGTPLLRYENNDWGSQTWLIHVTAPQIAHYIVYFDS